MAEIVHGDVRALPLRADAAPAREEEVGPVRAVGLTRGVDLDGRQIRKGAAQARNFSQCDSLLLGDASLKIEKIIVIEPDRGAGFMSFAPRVMLNQADLEATGLIQQIANGVLYCSQGELWLAIILILWVSAISSAFIDNIPFTATMLPVVLFMSDSFGLPKDNVLWWSLSLGACLGGNGTMIGASANVVTVGLAEKAGYHISFLAYMKACWWPMMITVTISMVYLLIAY